MTKIVHFAIKHNLYYDIEHEEKYKGNVIEREITFKTESGKVIQYFSLLSMKVYHYQLKYNGIIYKRSNIDSTLEKLEEILNQIENEVQ